MTTNLAHTSPALSDLDAQVRREVGDRFHIEGVHRRGPHSLVYRTGQVFAGKPIALKVISKGALAQRFARAAESAAQMEHPHVVPVLEWGETTQFLWYSMPLVEGKSLDRLLTDEGPLDIKRCLRMVEQVASALQYGHRRGVVHGNVKPENVIVGPDGWTLVTDFGMPGAVERAGQIGIPNRLFAYSAPELLERVQPVPASDQYSLAVMIHECLTGAVPSSPGSPDEPVPVNPKVARPRPMRSPQSLPERFIPALRRAMAQTPQERFPTVLGFIAILDGGPTPSLATSFTNSPNMKPEPRVLTMEPESRRGRLLLWTAVLALVAGAFLAGRHFAVPSQFQDLADRFDRWYEADAPPEGMVVGAPKPTITPSPKVSAPAPVDTQKPAAPAPKRNPPPTTPPVRQPVVQAPAPRPAPPPAAAVPSGPPEPGRLFINSSPWGTVYLDGRPVGNTPLLNLQVSVGSHSIRVVHDGFESYEDSIEIVSGEPLRLTGIVLQEKR